MNNRFDNKNNESNDHYNDDYRDQPHNKKPTVAPVAKEEVLREETRRPERSDRDDRTARDNRAVDNRRFAKAHETTKIVNEDHVSNTTAKTDNDHYNDDYRDQPHNKKPTVAPVAKKEVLREETRRPERSERVSRYDRIERSERVSRYDRIERSDRADRTARDDRAVDNRRFEKAHETTKIVNEDHVSNTTAKTDNDHYNDDYRDQPHNKKPTVAPVAKEEVLREETRRYQEDNYSSKRPSQNDRDDDYARVNSARPSRFDRR